MLTISTIIVTLLAITAGFAVGGVPVEAIPTRADGCFRPNAYEDISIESRSIWTDYVAEPVSWPFEAQRGWVVFVRTSPCSGRFDWVTVAQENPTGRGGSGYWETADLIITGTPMRCVRLASQCTKAAAEAEAVVVRASPRFSNYCCKEYSIWKNSQTGKWTIVVGKFGNPGPGWFFEDGPMCCEEAEAITGLTGACSGTTGNRGGGYIGCYKDTSVFDLNGHLERSNSNTPQACIATCKARGFAYAGVQYGQSCLCGNSYGKYGPADNCNMKCTGDAGQNCGGYNSNAVYSTGVSAGTTGKPGTLSTGLDLTGTWELNQDNSQRTWRYQVVLRPAGANTWEGLVTLETSSTNSFDVDYYTNTFTGSLTIVDKGEVPGGIRKIRTTFRSRRGQVTQNDDATVTHYRDPNRAQLTASPHVFKRKL